MATDVTMTANRLDVGAPRVLFDMGAVRPGGAPTWDAMPDGQRFLLIMAVGERPDQSLSLIVSWPALVGR